MQNPVITYRVATLGDADGILAVFNEVSPEIPLRETPKKQEMMEGITGECILTEESWVAVDAAGAIVAFALARMLPHKGSGLFLEYIGVSKTLRNRGIFTLLVEKLKAKDAPLNATVMHDNKSAMVDRLVRKGFTKEEADATQTKLRWSPLP